jgi:hypothetical protein
MNCRCRVNFAQSFPAALLTASLLLATGWVPPAAAQYNAVDNGWFRAWPPTSVAYSLPSTFGGGGTSSRNVDTLDVRATYIHSIKQADRFDWLAGADWQLIQSGAPSGSLLPETLQSAALVVGFDWFVHDRWRARLEVFPGVYGELRDFNSDSLNTPASVEASYLVNTNLLVGGQLSFNARRDAPVLGAVGVRWKFSDNWLLSLWFPRPRIEYSPAERWTLFGGATISGNTFVTGERFGTRRGRSELNDAPVDYQEIRLGVGWRYALPMHLAIELSGGWSVHRRYDFHEQGLALRSDGAPYVQIGFGLKF